MKILYVCKSLPHRFAGGIQTHVWELSGQMAGRGHEVSILTAGAWKQPETSYQLDFRNIIEIPYFPGRHLPILKTLAEEWAFNLSAYNWLKQHAFEYDLVHLQGRSGAWFAGNSERVPVISTIHGFVKTENITGNKEKLNWAQYLHEVWADKLELNGLTGSQKLIAVSRAMEAAIQARLGFNGRVVYHIPNGVSLPEHLQRERVTLSAPFWLFVGRLDRIKGVYVLLEAYRRSQSRMPLVLIGDGPERAGLLQKIKDWGLSERIIMPGSLPAVQVRAWMEQCYGLLLPSFFESQGLVLLEAMSVGAPVIASRTGGIPEFVEHYKNGLLIPSGDPTALSEAMEHLAQNPSLADQLGQAGSITAKDYAWEKIAADTERLYLELRGENQAVKAAENKAHYVTA